MFIFILFISIIGFGIYMFLNDGYIYIASNHFEKEISIKKIKEKKEKGPTCEKCGRYLSDEGTNICQTCLEKELTNYSSNNEFVDKKNSKKIF